MRERKPSRNCPLRGQSSNGSRRIVRRGLLVPDAEEPALFSRRLTKIRLTTPSWQDISDGNPHGESSFQFTWCSLEALDRKIPSPISTCIRKPRGGPRISRRIIASRKPEADASNVAISVLRSSALAIVGVTPASVSAGALKIAGGAIGNDRS